MFVTLIFVLVIIILILVYLKGIYNVYYWKRRGVVSYTKYKSGGPFWQYAVEDISFFEILAKIYKDYDKEPAVGLGSFMNQSLYVKDAQNIHHVLQSDFYSFNHRGFPINEEDRLANHVLFLDGPKWKLIRQKLTPLFTAAKLKNMYYICDKSAQDFVEFLKQNPDRLKGDTYDTLTHFTCAAVGAAVFGIGTEASFDSAFRSMAREVLVPTLKRNIKFAIAGFSDTLFKALKIKQFKEYEEFFIGAIKHVIQEREKDDLKMHDFIDLCINLRRQGTMHDPDTGLSLEPTHEMLAAQAFFFIIAGVEPSASGIYAVLLELGRHPDILAKVHKEVDAIFEEYNNELNYEAICKVKYLGNVFNEALRLHPPIGFLTRQCTRDSVLPVGNIQIEKGVKILTPIFELHHDSKYFNDPEKFDPDRFENDGGMSDVYMPFGKGNRICIGARFARVQILSGLMHLLRNYSVVSTVLKGGIKYNKEQVQVRPKNVEIELIPRIM